MSDQPTTALLGAIRGYSEAYSKDHRFQEILARLDQARKEVENLDPIADADQAREGHTRGETRRGHGDEVREGGDRNVEERGDVAQGAKKGAPDAEDRLDAEASRHREEDKPNEPPLKQAARRTRETFRTARRLAAESKAEEARDNKGRQGTR